MKKIVINKCYGGFEVCESIAKRYCLDRWDVERDDPRLVEAVERFPDECNSRGTNLVVIEIPESATDWDIDEYDGFERIIYVVDGKLQYK